MYVANKLCGGGVSEVIQIKRRGYQVRAQRELRDGLLRDSDDFLDGWQEKRRTRWFPPAAPPETPLWGSFANVLSPPTPG